MTTMARESLIGAVERAVLASHDGRSGSVIEQVRLADATRLVLKRIRPTVDLTAQICGGADRELELYVSGGLDMLPPEAGHVLIESVMWNE